MNCKKSFRSALIAAGIISSASMAMAFDTLNGTNEVHITGSTAFRGNFFSAATAASGGIFDAAPAVLPAGAGSGSAIIVYQGKIKGTPYALECSWSGSEAGIANIDGANSLGNPGLPNAFFASSANLPGLPTTFPGIDGLTSDGFTGAGDLSMADTSQAVSLTPSPALKDYGIVGVVTFVWEKGKNSTGLLTSTNAGDVAWARLSNVNEGQMQSLLTGTVNANFLTGNSNDQSLVILVGRNAGSGTHVNTMLDNFLPTGTSVNQFALNSFYSASGVLTFVTSNNFPSVAACFANQTDATTVPNALGIGDDGYDSGGGVSDNMSLDCSHSGFITMGYLGFNDAKNARDGNGAQPGGAVILNLDGNPFDDALVVNGVYNFWGHEHLLANTSAAIVNQAATNVVNGIASAGALGTGVSGQQHAGIVYLDMLADRPDNGPGYPVPGAP